MGIADPDRIGVIGHSHGGLMVANLLGALPICFVQGLHEVVHIIKPINPLDFKGNDVRFLKLPNRILTALPPSLLTRSMNLVLIIHGNDDSNPGTLTFQSEVFYEAVRGSGGTARLVLLPFEDHGYRAKGIHRTRFVGTNELV